MDKVRTGNTRLMRQGDECVFTNFADMKPEYHISKHKEYPGVIHSVRVDYCVQSNILNDIGEPSTQETCYGSFNGGFNNVEVVLPRDEYIKRVNALHAENISALMTKVTSDIHAECDRRDRLLEVANVAAPV